MTRVDDRDKTLCRGRYKCWTLQVVRQEGRVSTVGEEGRGSTVRDEVLLIVSDDVDDCW